MYIKEEYFGEIKMTLEDQIQYYLTKKNSVVKDLQEDEKLRQHFVSDYTLDTIKNMTIDDYVSGKPNSFCYRIEEELIGLGSIANSYASKKYGVYFNKEQNKYPCLKKFSRVQDPIEAFNNIKSAIINLIDAGRTHDLKSIKQNVISPMFKGKLLATYYPDDYLGIFSDAKLDIFLQEFCPKVNPKNLDAVDKREILVKFKNKHSVLKTFSMPEFAKFLYIALDAQLTSVTNKSSATLKEVLDDSTEELWPNITDVEPDFINIKYSDATVLSSLPARKSYANSDYPKVCKNNKELGDRGELVVQKAEKNKLLNLGLKSQAELVEIVSNDTSLGYDVKSFDENGNELHIEVKATKGSFENFHFYITSNELEKNKNDKAHVIYLVSEATKRKPKIFNLGKLIQSNITLVPVEYYANLIAIE